MTEPVPGPRRPTHMKTLAIAAVATALFLAGCGDSAGPTASDSADDESRPSMPTTIPAAPGAVATRGVVTVLDDGRPVVCLGPVAESWPPQCGGPPLVDWDWRKQRLVLGQPGAGPAYEQTGAVRWGRYFLTGAWDGHAFTVQTAVPEALYDGTAPEPAAAPDPGRDLSQAELEELAADLGGRLPGVLSSYVDGGRARIDVVYDDGSLQAWADATYGVGVVVVTPMLVDA